MVGQTLGRRNAAPVQRTRARPVPPESPSWVLRMEVLPQAPPRRKHRASDFRGNRRVAVMARPCPAHRVKSPPPRFPGRGAAGREPGASLFLPGPQDGRAGAGRPRPEGRLIDRTSSPSCSRPAWHPAVGPAARAHEENHRPPLTAYQVWEGMWTADQGETAGNRPALVRWPAWLHRAQPCIGTTPTWAHGRRPSGKPWGGWGKGLHRHPHHHLACRAGVWEGGNESRLAVRWRFLPPSLTVAELVDAYLADAVPLNAPPSLAVEPEGAGQAGGGGLRCKLDEWGKKRRYDRDRGEMVDLQRSSADAGVFAGQSQREKTETVWGRMLSEHLAPADRREEPKVSRGSGAVCGRPSETTRTVGKCRYGGRFPLPH